MITLTAKKSHYGWVLYIGTFVLKPLRAGLPYKIHNAQGIRGKYTIYMDEGVGYKTMIVNQRDLIYAFGEKEIFAALMKGDL